MIALRKALLVATTGAIVAVSSAAHAQPRGGASFAPESAVAVIVKVPKPWYAPRAVVAGKMRDTIPEYRAAPGLAFKAYSFARPDDQFGGVYLWKDLTSARAWFGPAWFERVKKERGVEGDVRLFEVPLALDNTPGGTPENRDAPAVTTLVEIPVPAGVPRQRIIEGFQASVPTYQAIPGLLRKYFIMTDQGTFGGIYLWQDEASARAWFNTAWQERVVKTYGQPARMEWFDTPILTTGSVPNGAWMKTRNPS